MVKFILPLHRAIEKATNNQVKITEYFAESLVAAADTYDAVVNGLVDIATVDTNYNPGRFDLTEAVALGGLGFVDEKIVTQALWDAYKEFPVVQKEFSDVHLLYLYSMPVPYLYSNKPIKTMADIKGMKVRSLPGPSFESLKLLGAVPVEVPFNELYQAMEKKTVDAFVSTYPGLMANKLNEVSKYACGPISFGSGIQAWCVLSLDKWNSLPKDVQKVFNDLTGDNFVYPILAQALLDIMNNYQAEAIKGGMVQSLPDDIDKWNQALSPVTQNWINRMNAKGFPATQIVDYVKSRIAFYGKK
jgi:TRAP-type C4-dicarboxylate transport system substrate-binding protein